MLLALTKLAIRLLLLMPTIVIIQLNYRIAIDHIKLTTYITNLKENRQIHGQNTLLKQDTIQTQDFLQDRGGERFLRTTSTNITLFPWREGRK
jgi:hypothetical protein